jgi:hypothetical protein
VEKKVGCEGKREEEENFRKEKKQMIKILKIIMIVIKN